MSARITKPLSQIKLTNVAIVRLRKDGKRFEVACYKNKILEWRNKVETDLDNVLQIHQVFLNVSKGQVASKDDFMRAFKTDDVNSVIIQILEKGEVQVGEKERAQQLDSMYRDIATIVAEKTIHPETKRPYTSTMIEKALKEIHFSVHASRSAKQQALEAIRMLQEKGAVPIARARMRVQVTMPAKDGKRLRERILEHASRVEEDWGDRYELTCVIEPGSFRVIGDLLQEETRGRGHVEVLSVSEGE